jgi:glycosyltransferase involved in cell wall biosynthesis
LSVHPDHAAVNRPVVTGLVTTIIPVYNRPGLLREAVASVLAQTYRPIEIVIVDDGSTDDTPQVAEGFQAEHPDFVRVLRQPNAGPGVARQVGLETSRGEFIQFLDSDDLLLPRKFELQVAGLQSDPEAGIAYGKIYSRQDGVRLPDAAQHTGERYRTLFPALLKEPLWPTQAPLYRRSVLDAVGPWPAKKQLEDWEFDAQAGALGIKLHYCDDYVAETRNHDETRLCHLWMTDYEAMRDRVGAYVAVLGHAQRAGVARESPEMQQFARSLFWVARNAASRGMSGEARQLFGLARGLTLNPGWDYRVFGIAAAVLGWKRAGRLADFIDGWRG